MFIFFCSEKTLLLGDFVLELWFFTLVFLLCDFYLRNTFVVFIV